MYFTKEIIFFAFIIKVAKFFMPTIIIYLTSESKIYNVVIFSNKRCHIICQTISTGYNHNIMKEMRNLK